MEEFQRLIKAKDDAEQNAIYFWKKNDMAMATFWKKASVNFYNQAMELSL